MRLLLYFLTLVAVAWALVASAQQVPLSTTSLISSGQVSVGATATPIVVQRARQAVTIENTTTTAIYLGPAGVTTTTGHLLPGIVGSSITLNTNAPVYGVVASGTATVTELESY